MFNRLRTIWLKAQWLPARKLREEPLKRQLPKNKQCEKLALPWASTLVALRQGYREGGQWPRGPWSLRGPWASGAHGNDTDKSVCGTSKTFFLFFLRSHQNPEKIGAFSCSFLEFTKPEMRNIWANSGPTFGSRRPCKQLASTSIAFCGK